MASVLGQTQVEPEDIRVGEEGRARGGRLVTVGGGRYPAVVAAPDQHRHAECPGVEVPNDAFVTQNTPFWNVSGVEFGKVTNIQLDYAEKLQIFPGGGRCGDLDAAPGTYPPENAQGVRQHRGGPERRHPCDRQLRRARHAHPGSQWQPVDRAAVHLAADAKPVAFDATARPLRIPTVPSSLAKLQEQLQAVVDRIGKLPHRQQLGRQPA